MNILILLSIFIAYTAYVVKRKNKSYRKEALKISDGVIEAMAIGLSFIVANVAAMVLINKLSVAFVTFTVAVTLFAIAATVVKATKQTKTL